MIVSSPDQLIWEGKADSVSSENSAGLFDVLPGHARFITMIESKPIIAHQPQGDKVFHYHNAVLTVKDDTVIVYADI